MPASSRLAADYLRLVAPHVAFDTFVHPSDEMHATLRQLGLAADAAEFEYLRSGREPLQLLEHVLRRAGTRCAEQASLLEFACGYGRLTRWLVHALPAARVHASDIMPEAVAHVRASHGVHAFVSDTQPEHVELGGPHDLIWVGSLFSHLPEPRFRAWLARLGASLSPRGLLAFSTHGESLQAADARNERGFVFEPHSENQRLVSTEYGTTYVRPATVAAWTRELGLAHVSCAEREVWLTQDLHVVARAPRELAPLPLNAPFARGRFELCTCDERGLGRVGGWVRLPAQAGAPVGVELHIDVEHVYAAQLGPVLEQQEGAARWLARAWFLEGDLARFGAGVHSVCAYGRSRDGDATCFDARSLTVP
jgi:trans-aconitate methyltransferase